MSNSSMLGWYHPSTVVFVDDNPNFLESIILGLDTKVIVPKFFTNPLDAIKFILDKKQKEVKETSGLMHSQIQGAGSQSVDIDINAIHEPVFSSERFSQISLVVVDFAMAQLNGLELCEKISLGGRSFKILMLTGEADDKLAIQAFNDGVIDYFIRKKTNNDAEFQADLNKAIETLQDAHFAEKSENIITGLCQEEQNPAFCLNDLAFIQVFREIYKENDVAEYYLLDTDGSYLLVSYSGNLMILAVKSEQGMQDAYQVALNADDPFPPEILEAMEKHEKILYLYQQDICDDSKEAIKYLHPAVKVVGKEIYYYALIKNLESYNIDKENIVGFQKYSENLNPEI